MSFFDSMNISSSGLTAQRLRMDLISQNIANATTSRTANGTPYRRKTLLFEEKQKSFSDILNSKMRATITGSADGFTGEDTGSGVRVTKIIEDQTDFKKVYDPGHPDADEDGYVSMPNVDVVTEMVNMISASRTYEANITAMNTSKSMAVKALDIGK